MGSRSGSTPATIMLVDRGGNVVWRFTGPDGDERLDEFLAARAED